MVTGGHFRVRHKQFYEQFCANHPALGSKVSKRVVSLWQKNLLMLDIKDVLCGVETFDAFASRIRNAAAPADAAAATDSASASVGAGAKRFKSAAAASTPSDSDSDSDDNDDRSEPATDDSGGADDASGDGSAYSDHGDSESDDQ
jgi:hypothetical protein